MGVRFRSPDGIAHNSYQVPDSKARSIASLDLFSHRPGFYNESFHQCHSTFFAFNVYDVGGLLDANVAGYPNSLTDGDLQKIKGTLAGADLSRIGLGSAEVTALVSWRNPSALASSATYVRGTEAQTVLPPASSRVRHRMTGGSHHEPSCCGGQTKTGVPLLI